MNAYNAAQGGRCFGPVRKLRQPHLYWDKRDEYEFIGNRFRCCGHFDLSPISSFRRARMVFLITDGKLIYYVLAKCCAKFPLGDGKKTVHVFFPLKSRKKALDCTSEHGERRFVKRNSGRGWRQFGKKKEGTEKFQEGGKEIKGAGERGRGWEL